MKELGAFVLSSPVSASELGQDPTAYVYGLKVDAIQQTIVSENRYFTKQEWDEFSLNTFCSGAAKYGNHSSIDTIERRVKEMRDEVEEMKHIINSIFSLETPVAV